MHVLLGFGLLGSVSPMVWFSLAVQIYHCNLGCLEVDLLLNYNHFFGFFSCIWVSRTGSE